MIGGGVRPHSIVASTIATIGLVLVMGSIADARRQRTPSLAQEPAGYVYCKATATSVKPIDLVASIISDAGTNVTEFGYGSRVKTEDGFDAEETAGSFNHESARYYCRITVMGARRRNVQVSLGAFDKDGVCVATVEMR